MSKERLFEDFPPVSDEQWRSVVERDLKGADYERTLVWRSHAGLTVQPYYRRQDLKRLSYLTKQTPGTFPYVRGKKTDDNRWLICQAITRRSPADANAVALKALSSGAEAVAFRSSVSQGKLHGQRVLNLKDFETLISDVDLTNVPVHFDWASCTPQATAYLKAYCDKNGIAASSVTGSMEFDPLGCISGSGRAPADVTRYWDNIAVYLKDAKKALPGMKHLVIHTSVYLEAGSSLVQDLALVLSQTVEILNALTDRGLTAEEVLKLMGVKVAVSSSYFMEIAFFRALRLLWADIATAYDVRGEAAQLWVHAEACSLNKTIYDPHVNILRQATETMSAVLGGVDTMSVEPWDTVCGTSTEASERLARNGQLVIREESGLDHAVDPSAGSYYIESLTDGLAEQAWKTFQTLEAGGGFLAALEAGTISTWLKESRGVLDKGVASRRITLLGTNQFPNGNELMAAKLDLDDGLALQAAKLAPCPSKLSDMISIATDGLPFTDPFLVEVKEIPALPSQLRLAQSYERLRLQVEALEKQPCVYLWTFGNLGMRKARAGFCQNLYACAGFKVVEGKGSSSSKENLDLVEETGAKWIVFCSSDDDYPAAVPGFVQAALQRFPSLVPVVAGYPQDSIEALKQAGVIDFVHLKTEAVSYLSQCVKLARGEK